MKKNYFLFAILFCAWSYSSAQTVLWHEDFSNEADGATTNNGTVAGTLGGSWSCTLPTGGAASFSKQSPVPGVIERFRANQTGTEGVWRSNTINISTSGQVGISVDLVNYYASATDYVRAYYILNGVGGEVKFGEVTGSAAGLSYNANASVILSGTSVQIVIRAFENTAGNDPDLGLPRNMGFDDMELVQISTLYSIGNGDWNNTATWSYTSGAPETSCGCTPNNSTHVVVEDGDIVSIPAEANAVNVTVQNTATLRWTANVDLNIHRGGSITVNNTASMTRNGNATAQIDFDFAHTNVVTVNSTNTNALSIGDIEINGAGNITFTGSGRIVCSDDFLVNAAATITFSGTGTFDAVDDFSILSNATITNNKSGTFTIGDDINFNTDNATFNNTGPMVIADLIVNDNGDDGNVFNNNAGGTLTVGTITPNDGNLTINNLGTITQSGNFANNTLDAGSSFVNGATGTWNWNYVFGAANDASLSTVLNCSASGNTFNYSAAGDQTILAIQYHHLGGSGSGNKTIGAAIDMNGNLTLSGSAVFVTGNFNVNVGGNWSVTGTASYTEGTNTTTFDGSGNQSITNASGETFNLLVVNKSAGSLTLNNNVTVTSTTGTGLTLTQGVVNSSSTALLIINDNVTTSGGNANSFVDGPIRKVGNEAFIFPTGDGTRWARIATTNVTGATVTTQFTAQYFATPYSTFARDNTFDHVSGGEYWTLDRAVNTPTARVVLYWQNSFSNITNLPDLIVARYTGTLWTDAGRAGGTTGVAAGPGTITSSDVTSFSPFSFGSDGGINPLPVELISFKARLENDQVRLDWQTASELNNDHFTVERAVNIESFEPVGEDVPGNGTTSEAHSYSLIDNEPFYGRSYYRLKQTDFDGQHSYSPVQVIDFEGPSFASLRVYPNPYSQQQDLTVEIRGLKGATTANLEMLNSHGQPVLNRVIEIKTPGTVRVPLIFDKPLPAGLYILRAGTTPFLTQKFVVE